MKKKSEIGQIKKSKVKSIPLPDVKVNLKPETFAKNFSFISLYCDEDAHFVNNMINSVPVGAEICLLYTRPIDDIKFTIPSIQNLTTTNIDETTILHKGELWYYKNDKVDTFHFSNAFNACKSLATREWCVKIDADEEISISEDELKYIAQAPFTMGAFKCNLHSWMLPEGNQIKEALINSHQPVKIFRNKPEIKYSNRVHEQIAQCIINLGYNIGLTSVMFKHMGYHGGTKNIKSKLERNFQYLLSDLLEKPLDSWQLYNLDRTLEQMKNFKYYSTNLNDYS